MFITFEGIDGSGKSTQIRLLKDALKEKGHQVEVFREPGGSSLSEQIRSQLLNPELDIHPITELLLFSAARSQLIFEKVKPLLGKGTVVILDRFYDSTTAYQGYGRRSVPLTQIKELNTIASHGMTPDITFYLQISLGEAKKRTAKKRKDRMEQSGDLFYEKVIQGFDILAESESRFITLDATEALQKVHQEIWEKVSAHL